MIPLIYYILLFGLYYYSFHYYPDYNQHHVVLVMIMMALFSLPIKQISLLCLIPLWTIFWCDVYHRIIPNWCHIMLIIHFIQAPIDLFLPCIVLTILSIISYFQWLGFGDVKLLTVFSLHVNLMQLNLLIFMASTLALLWFVIKKQKRDTLIPFGSFLSIAYLLMTYII